MPSSRLSSFKRPCRAPGFPSTLGTAHNLLRPPLALLAGLILQWLLRLGWPAAPFLPYSIGDWIIRCTPGDLATEMIERLGAHASDLLAISITVALLTASLGLLRLPPLAVGACLACATLIAAAIDPVPIEIRYAAGSAILAGLATWMAALALTSRRPAAYLPERRRLIAGWAGLSLLLLGGGSAALVRRSRLRAAAPVGATNQTYLAPDAEFPETPGLSPRITEPADHYIVDIDLSRPQIDASEWRLAVGGDAANPRSFSFNDLRAFASQELPILMHCISNPVGGKLISNAAWVTAPLVSILDLVSPRSTARLIRVEAADDYDEVIPIGDAGKVLVAWAMGGRELAPAHGYPVRVIFPGRYGMRSVKWVTALKLQGAGTESYWGRRGWDDEAVMRTGARIDTPAEGANVPRDVVIAGIAWAGTRGVSAVELSFDGEHTWQPAQIEAATNELSWRRWRLTAALPAGRRIIAVRAIDGEGMIQDAEPRFPHPSGATGYHRIKVTART